MILVTGGSGLVGTYLKKYLPNAHYITSKEFDLTKESDVISMFEKYKPNVVIHLAARVGGILDNISNPYDYFIENVLMNTLVLKYSNLYNVERFLGVLSTCIYPDNLGEYPLIESDLHLGPPTETNFSYGYAKRCLAVQIDMINKQYDKKYNYLIPCNLYGVGDKNDETKSHFVTALIKKIFEDNKEKNKTISLFGDGTPIRQFMFADDFAKIIFEVINKNIYESFNVATNETYTIDEIAKIALNACDSAHLEIIYDKNKPNGQFRKDVSIQKLINLLPNFKFTSLENGIKLTYQNYDKISQ